MKMTSLFLTIAFLAMPAQAAESRNIGEYNLTNSVGLKGFDPVSTFPEGGMKPTAGNSKISLVYQGVTYLFVNAKNRDTFLTDPAKYESTYGGWCAYAMAYGSKVDIQPQFFTLRGRRAHYFISARAKQNFDRDVVNQEKQADINWRKFSKEEPRF